MAIKDSTGIGCLDIGISRIPEDWQTVKLKEIISLEYGKGLSERNRERGLFPVVGSNGVVGFHNLALVKGPGIVVGRKGTIGAVSLIELDFWPIDTTYYIRILNKEISLEWLFFALVKLNLPKLSMSDVVPGLKRELAYNLKLLIPPLAEQKTIAEILSTVDQAIEKVDEAIEKTQRLKKGLMQELLTKGIGHKEFKDTEIGRIPKEWELVQLKMVVVSYKNGIYKPNEFYGSGYPSIRMYNITSGRINLIDAPLLQVTEQELRDYGLIEGDILINRVNTADLVGRAGVVPPGLGKMTFESKNIRLRLNKIKVFSDFFAVFVQTSAYAKQIRAHAKVAVAQATITQDDIGGVRFPLPPLPEQQQIAEILSAVDERLDLLRTRKEKLEMIKKGLMNDLLTGRKRVRLEA